MIKRKVTLRPQHLDQDEQHPVEYCAHAVAFPLPTITAVTALALDSFNPIEMPPPFRDLIPLRTIFEI